MVDNDEDVQIVKKAKLSNPKINWSDTELVKAALKQILVDRCHVAIKGKAQKFVVTAASLVKFDKNFHGLELSGPNLQAKMTTIVAKYYGEHLSDTANKSGHDGDQVLTDVEELAKEIYEGIEKLEDQAKSSKVGEAELYKVKSQLESSVLAVPNKSLKSSIPTIKNSDKKQNFGSASFQSPNSDTSDPMIGFLSEFSETKKEESSLNKIKFDELKRANLVQEGITERQIRLQEEKQTLDNRRLEFEMKKWESEHK